VPVSEGRACRVRWTGMDHQTWWTAPDKQVPPGGGGACLSCPRNRDGWSNVARRTWQARPSKKRTWQAGPSEKRTWQAGSPKDTGERCLCRVSSQL